MEAYCSRKWSTKKDKHLYKLVDSKSLKMEKEPNPNYDPNYKTPKKPSYCPNLPRYICLEKNCHHLAYTDALEGDYHFLDKKYNKSKRK
ncbi:MAG: hypothetical protein PHD95_01415 [Candidatus ainarchaeum sp.]|nr:hypothetical protein [Candidatus ainarchaeum sp.]